MNERVKVLVEGGKLVETFVSGVCDPVVPLSLGS